MSATFNSPVTHSVGDEEVTLLASQNMQSTFVKVIFHERIIQGDEYIITITDTITDEIAGVPNIQTVDYNTSRQGRVTQWNLPWFPSTNLAMTIRKTRDHRGAVQPSNVTVQRVTI